MTKKEILLKMATILPNSVPKFGIPQSAPGLINKIPKLTNINFNAKKISTNIPGGALRISKVITNG